MDEGLLRREIERRKTFSIISHPDAGKTTLTEKLLLYGGAIHLAGSVKLAKAARRHATQRLDGDGEASAASPSPRACMQFPYAGRAG